ncbi:hypothetical protein [Nannocystis pusilla]|uniref:Uncharacterized protein n=1 Tax=Nannocystis pusilla TaxID=889268 RepID=A0ABS7TPV2_9BACT|nr:hypothetical protein [Nannocystis pusilla]MBZ5710101.1 hypothetical protein [Nannocystis pusilla]
MIELPTLAGRGMTIEEMSHRGEIVGVVLSGGGQVPTRCHGGDERVVDALPSDALGGEPGDIDEHGRLLGAYRRAA